ncbi:MAG: AMP-binding protein [Rhodobiaceae bacterium]|nr:AMP-binding protein [Rhodobiaceae bacterium]MCC0012271.1 AMP-binding protein [Rhodobiaceae bacterium]MCC0050873.1 AMP-binding protein [Rhodobiaceae bacterium]MCC0060814.1 AMP-binding protein [Rhodobiaceae bacterium]
MDASSGHADETLIAPDGSVHAIPNGPLPHPGFSAMPLFEALVVAAGKYGSNTAIAADAETLAISYKRLILGALVLGGRFARITLKGERVGVLLPTAVGGAVTYFALQAFGRVPAMLNFSTGITSTRACVHAAEVDLILTSRRFVEKAGLEPLIEALEEDARIVYIDELRETLTAMDKLKGAVRATFARLFCRMHKPDPDDAAAVIFTSGTEGVPKGVVLTHRNILSNCDQFLSYVGLGPPDRLFSALPVFHSFGMTCGMIAPMLAGIPVFLYPSPLHYKQIPPLVRKFTATILVGTDTFAMGWGRVARKEDFSSVRVGFLGAEKIRESTRAYYEEKFDFPLVEGYGASEASPAIAANTLEFRKDGSVGRPMPGIDVRIDPVPGLADAGRLVVRGPNVMAGYLTVDAPGVLKPPEGGWHDTGDIVSIDEDWFITIRGRAKRFAKIAGEMVSLAGSEARISALWPDNVHAVVAIRHPKKGEELVLVTDNMDAGREELVAFFQKRGFGEIMIPRRIVRVGELPVMATGKLDYPAVMEIAEAKVRETPEA